MSDDDRTQSEAQVEAPASPTASTLSFPASTAPAAELSEEQKAFLAECEEAFANRYTDADKEFAQFKNAPRVDPPCVHPWRVRPRRDFHVRIPDLACASAFFKIFR